MDRPNAGDYIISKIDIWSNGNMRRAIEKGKSYQVSDWSHGLKSNEINIIGTIGDLRTISIDNIEESDG